MGKGKKRVDFTMGQQRRAQTPNKEVLGNNEHNLRIKNRGGKHRKGVNISRKEDWRGPGQKGRNYSGVGGLIKKKKIQERSQTTTTTEEEIHNLGGEGVEKKLWAAKV